MKTIDFKKVFEQAIMVAQNQDVNLAEVKRWAKSEKHLDKFREFISCAKRKNSPS